MLLLDRHYVNLIPKWMLRSTSRKWNFSSWMPSKGCFYIGVKYIYFHGHLHIMLVLYPRTMAHKFRIIRSLRPCSELHCQLAVVRLDRVWLQLQTFVLSTSLATAGKVTYTSICSPPAANQKAVSLGRHASSFTNTRSSWDELLAYLSMPLSSQKIYFIPL